MNDLSTEIEKITFENYQHNLSVLKELKETIEREFLKEEITDDAFVENLYSDDINDKWFLSQCQSICNQIEKIVNKDSKFNEFYSQILTDNDKIRLSQELICDISYLEQLTGYQYKINKEGEKISRPDYLSSNLFFLHAKFSYFTNQHIPETTSRHFAFSSMPTLIRQAIELKVKRMIGLEKVTKKNGGFKMIGISSILDFFIKNSSYFNMPVPFKTLKDINGWTNSFVHTGIAPFCWQSLEAIDLIEKLFSIEESGAWDIEGFSYLKISLTELKDFLDSEFDADFTLTVNRTEGSLLNS